ncbi:hypothetical protein PG984_000024 [Apiospora sp. TS-2023a]
MVPWESTRNHFLYAPGDLHYQFDLNPKYLSTTRKTAKDPYPEHDIEQHSQRESGKRNLWPDGRFPDVLPLDVSNDCNKNWCSGPELTSSNAPPLLGMQYVCTHKKHYKRLLQRLLDDPGQSKKPVDLYPGAGVRELGLTVSAAEAAVEDDFRKELPRTNDANLGLASPPKTPATAQRAVGR